MELCVECKIKIEFKLVKHTLFQFVTKFLSTTTNLVPIILKLTHLVTVGKHNRTNIFTVPG